MMRKAYTPQEPTETQLQETCCAYLELDGWRRIRTDMKQLRGMGVQEPGMADDLFIRYNDYKLGDREAWWADVLWIEWKKKGGKAGAHQIEWHALERVRGALTWIAGIDFPPTIEGFQDHYRKSGLRRNTGL